MTLEPANGIHPAYMRKIFIHILENSSQTSAWHHPQPVTPAVRDISWSSHVSCLHTRSWKGIFPDWFYAKIPVQNTPEKGRSILLRRNAGFLQSFSESLCHASAGPITAQGANKCSARFLSRQLGDSDTKFQGRQTLALKHPEWTPSKASWEPTQTFCCSVYYQVKQSLLARCSQLSCSKILAGNRERTVFLSFLFF